RARWQSLVHRVRGKQDWAHHHELVSLSGNVMAWAACLQPIHIPRDYLTGVLVLQRDFTNVALATEQAGACDESNRPRSCGVVGKRSKPRLLANLTPVGARRPVIASVPEQR